MSTLRTNYVLIDFENVQPESLDQLADDHFKIFVFVGARQTTLPLKMAKSSQPLGDRAEYIQILGNGPNALDFHIAYYIGRLEVADPSAYFHIVSKDTGFDPLIRYLRAKKIFAGRVTAISEIPIVKISNTRSLAERIDLILAKLRHLKTAKPATVKALSNHIRMWFQKQLSEEEVSGLVEEMAKRRYLTISSTKITYALPK